MKKIFLILFLMFSLLIGCNSPKIVKLEFETFSVSDTNNSNSDFVYDFEFIHSYEKLLSLQNKIKVDNSDVNFNFKEEDLLNSKILLIQTQKRSITDSFSLAKVGYLDETIIIEAIYEKVYWNVHMSAIAYSFIKIPKDKEFETLELNITYLIQQKDLKKYTKDKLEFEISINVDNQNI